MGAPIDKTSTISTGSDPFANEELGMSIAPQDAQNYVSTDNLSSQPIDSFAEPLTLDSTISVNQGSQVRQVAIRDVLEDAGRGRIWAIDALDTFLTQRLDAYSPETQVCYESCQDNIGPILAQLRSDDVTERREGVRSLLGILLGQATDADETSDDLRRGLLVAARKISEIKQDDIFYQELAQLDPASRQQIRQLVNNGQIPSDPQLMQATRVQPNESQNQNAEAESAPAEVAHGGGGISPEALAAAQSSSEATPASQASTSPSLNFANFEGLVQNSVSKALADHGLSEDFLGGQSIRGLQNRLQDILHTPGLNTSQVSQTLYYAILNRAWQNPEFTSTENHYAEFRPAARQVAQDILRRVGIPESSGGQSLPNELAIGTSRLAQGTETSTPSAPPPGVRSTRPEGFALGSLQGPAQNPDAAPTTPGLGLPTTSTVAAGMMGLNFFALAGRPVWQSLGFNSDRPEYFIEGATAADGEDHHGSGSDSDQQDEQSRQDASGSDNVFVA